MGFLPHEIEWEVDKWIDRFMNGETDDSLYSFIKETIFDEIKFSFKEIPFALIPNSL